MAAKTTMNTSVDAYITTAVALKIKETCYYILFKIRTTSVDAYITTAVALEIKIIHIYLKKKINVEFYITTAVALEIKSVLYNVFIFTIIQVLIDISLQRSLCRD